VQFFDEDDRLVETVSRFVLESIESGCSCLAIATAEHRKAIDRNLHSAGFDVATLIAQYRYIPLNARAVLSTFMLGGQPDQQRFHLNMDLLIRQVAARGQPVCIFGEMVAVLLAERHAAAALRLEELWNELSRQHDFTLFCAYPSCDLARDARLHRLICAVHSSVLATPC